MAKKPRINSLLDDVANKVTQPQGIRAYHGSPHDFDRFDLSKIGTGEGAQAYGHGLYFAENEGVAKGYRDALSAQPLNNMNNAISAAFNFSGPENITAEKMRDYMVREGIPRANITPEIVDYAMQAARGQGADGSVSDAALDAYRKLGTLLGNNGNMYEVNIRANPADFLDWDKPLGQQPKKVQELFNPRLVQGRGFTDEEFRSEFKNPLAGTPYENLGDSRLTFEPLLRDAEKSKKFVDLVNKTHPDAAQALVSAQKRYFDNGWNGQDAYTAFAKIGGEYVGYDAVKASQMLNEAGIPGIKYLDAGSRSAGDGSRNYVVFDDALIDIIRKYGIVPGGLLGAGAAMAPSDAQAAPSRPDWIGDNGAITGNPPWLRPDPNQRSTLGKLYDAVTADPVGTFKAAGSALTDAVKGYMGEVRNDPGKGAADALELGVTAMGGAIPQALWMAGSPDAANAGEDAILAQRRKMMQGLLAD